MYERIARTLRSRKKELSSKIKKSIGPRIGIRDRKVVLIRLGAKLTARDYRSLAELRHQIRLFAHFSKQAVRSAGLNPHQHQLMLALKGLPPNLRPSIRELAKRLQTRHHSTVELVNRLARRVRASPAWRRGPAGTSDIAHCQRRKGTE